jgi:hypothetical protein
VKAWKVEIRKYGDPDPMTTTVAAALMSDAVENALDEFGLIHEESGSFQITITETPS